MGCLKLTYKTEMQVLRTCKPLPSHEEKGVQRFLSLDPLFKSYPWYTPYQFAGNKPIIAIDLDGLEEFVIIQEHYSSKKEPEIKLSFDWEAEKLAEGNYYIVHNYYDADGNVVSKQTNTTSEFKIIPMKAETEKNWLQKAWDNVKNWHEGGEKSKFGGGFMLVSEKGEGTGKGREIGDNVDPNEITILNIDDFPMPNGGGGTLRGGGKLDAIGDILEKLDHTLDGVDAAKSLNEAVVGEAVQGNEVKKDSCTLCRKTGSHEEMKDYHLNLVPINDKSTTETSQSYEK